MLEPRVGDQDRPAARLVTQMNAFGRLHPDESERPLRRLVPKKTAASWEKSA